MHGGTNDGAPKENRNAVKTGAYQRVLSQEDQVKFEALKEELGKLDAEVTLARFQLENVLEQRDKWNLAHPGWKRGLEVLADDSVEGMVLEEMQDTDAGAFPGRKIVVRRPAFEDEMHRLLRAIFSGEKERAKLIEQGDLVDRMAKLQSVQAELLEKIKNGDPENGAQPDPRLDAGEEGEGGAPEAPGARSQKSG
tara:strand:- start:12386 stop:12970 length:585 start_codon:yes stop_codon:yes gene_type:complete